MMVWVRRRVSVQAMKTVSRMVIVRSEMRTKTPSGSKTPGTQPSPPAIKEVRSPGRTIKCPGAQASPPAVRDLTACAV